MIQIPSHNRDVFLPIFPYIFVKMYSAEIINIVGIDTRRTYSFLKASGILKWILLFQFVLKKTKLVLLFFVDYTPPRGDEDILTFLALPLPPLVGVLLFRIFIHNLVNS